MSAPELNNITDAGLLAQYYTDGNNEWLGLLMQRYTLLLYGVCMKYLKNEEEAKDAVQQIFLKVIAELQKYPVTYFKSWLYMIAKNYCLMQLRDKGKNTLPVTEKMIISPPEESNGTLYQWQKDITLDALHDAVDELNAEQKQCIILFYLKKKSYHEIATITGFTTMQVKSYLQNGKRNLKLSIEKKMKNNKV